MYVYVTVWKYYMKNDFEYGEEGIHVMDIRCTAIISSSNIDVCALLEQEAICSYPFPVASISEVLPYSVIALMSTPFSALAGQTAREAHTSVVPSHPVALMSAPFSSSNMLMVISQSPHKRGVAKFCSSIDVGALLEQ